MRLSQYWVAGELLLVDLELLSIVIDLDHSSIANLGFIMQATTASSMVEIFDSNLAAASTTATTTVES